MSFPTSSFPSWQRQAIPPPQFFEPPSSRGLPPPPQFSEPSSMVRNPPRTVTESPQYFGPPSMVHSPPRMVTESSQFFGPPSMVRNPPTMVMAPPQFFGPPSMVRNPFGTAMAPPQFFGPPSMVRNPPTTIESLEIPCLPCGVCKFRFRSGEVIQAFLPEHPEHRNDDCVTIRCRWHCPICKGSFRGRRRSALTIKGCHFDSPRFDHRFRPEYIPDRHRQMVLDLAYVLPVMLKFVNNGITARFSIEIWALIAEYLLPANIVFEEEDAPKPKKPMMYRILPCSAIFASFTKYEGRAYLSSISNTPRAYNSRSVVMVAKPDVKERVLHYRTDHFGIRSMCVTRPGQFPPYMKEVPGEWWRSVTLKNSCHIKATPDAQIQGDETVSIVRELTAEHRPEMFYSPVAAAPGDNVASVCAVAATQSQMGVPPTAFSILPRGTPRFEYFDGLESNTTGHMRSVVLNHPNAMGYSFVWAASLGVLIEIHAHMRGDDPLAFYRMHDHACYLYMPLNANELINTIWMGASACEADNAIGLKTNLGRYFYAGRRPPSNEVRWRVISLPTREPYRMYYDASHEGMKAVAIEDRCVLQMDKKQLNKAFRVERPMETVHLRSAARFFSQSNLLGLWDMIPCQAHGAKGITGLILRYGNGHSETIGHVRLDCLLHPIPFFSGNTAFMLFSISKQGKAFLHSISVFPPRVACPERDIVIRIFAAGVMEWFWTPDETFVTYCGQRSYHVQRVVASPRSPDGFPGPYEVYPVTAGYDE